MKKNKSFMLFNIIGTIMVLANIVCGFFYLQGFYYFAIGFAWVGIASIISLAIGIIYTKVKGKKRKKKKEEDGFTGEVIDTKQRIDPNRLLRFADNLYMYVNYDKEAQRANAYGRDLKEKREYYELAVLSSLESFFKDKSKSEIEEAIMMMKRKL